MQTVNLSMISIEGDFSIYPLFGQIKKVTEIYRNGLFSSTAGLAPKTYIILELKVLIFIKWEKLLIKKLNFDLKYFIYETAHAY